MGEFKGTKGGVFIKSDGMNIHVVVGDRSVATLFNCSVGDEDSTLIADAFNVRKQINFDLPNLLKQRNEMLSMLEKVNATILEDTGGSLELIKLRREIESLIKKATEV